MKTLILAVLFVILAVPNIWADDIDKLENAYIQKANQLRTDRDKKVKVIDEKYQKDSLALADSYVKSLKRIEKQIVQKGDLDGALKVRNKIKEIEKALPAGNNTAKISRLELIRNLGYATRAHPRLAKQGPNGHWYLVVSSKVGFTFKDAVDTARKMGGYLATIISKEENDFITRLTSGAYAIRVGGVIKNGKWSWITGEKWGYANWGKTANSQFPTGEGTTLGIYGQLHGKEFDAPSWNGTWKDYPNNLKGDGGRLPIFAVIEWEN
jgi:hypothetical protein